MSPVTGQSTPSLACYDSLLLLLKYPGPRLAQVMLQQLKAYMPTSDQSLGLQNFEPAVAAVPYGDTTL